MITCLRSCGRLAPEMVLKHCRGWNPDFTVEWATSFSWKKMSWGGLCKTRNCPQKFCVFWPSTWSTANVWNIWCIPLFHLAYYCRAGSLALFRHQAIKSGSIVIKKISECERHGWSDMAHRKLTLCKYPAGNYGGSDYSRISAEKHWASKVFMTCMEAELSR